MLALIGRNPSTTKSYFSIHHISMHCHFSSGSLSQWTWCNSFYDEIHGFAKNFGQLLCHLAVPNRVATWKNKMLDCLLWCCSTKTWFHQCIASSCMHPDHQYQSSSTWYWERILTSCQISCRVLRNGSHQVSFQHKNLISPPHPAAWKSVITLNLFYIGPQELSYSQNKVDSSNKVRLMPCRSCGN